MNSSRTQLKSACCLALALAVGSTLVACGGGGGSSSNSAVVPPEPTPPPPVQEEPVDFNETVLTLAAVAVAEGEVEDDPVVVNEVLWEIGDEEIPMEGYFQ